MSFLKHRGGYYGKPSLTVIEIEEKSAICLSVRLPGDGQTEETDGLENFENGLDF